MAHGSGEKPTPPATQEVKLGGGGGGMPWWAQLVIALTTLGTAALGGAGYDGWEGRREHRRADEAVEERNARVPSAVVIHLSGVIEDQERQLRSCETARAGLPEEE